MRAMYTNAVRTILIQKQAKCTLSHHKGHQTKSQRALVVSKECYFLHTNETRKYCAVTGTHDSGRNYAI